MTLPLPLPLLDQHCTDHAGALDAAALADLLTQLPAWSVVDGQLRRDFAFRNYHATIAFVDALAEMVHHENHHPELLLTYQHCVARFNTHSAGGAITANDAICAAKADRIYAQQGGA